MKAPPDLEQLKEAYREDGRQWREIQRYMYAQWRPQIVVRLTARGASHAEAEDIFQNGIVAFMTNILTGKFQGKSTLQTYLTSICDYMWYSYYRKQRRRQEALEDYEVADSEDDPLWLMWDRELKATLDASLAKLGKKCEKLLTLWAEGYAYKQILEKLRFPSEGAARKKKHTCMKRFMELLKSNPVLWEQLNDLR